MGIYLQILDTLGVNRKGGKERWSCCCGRRREGKEVGKEEAIMQKMVICF